MMLSDSFIGLIAGKIYPKPPSLLAKNMVSGEDFPSTQSNNSDILW